jgi:ABC-2 type transport system permease protein
VDGRTISRAAIYAHIGRSRLRAGAQYRLSFVLQIVGSGLLSGLDFIAVLVIFTSIDALAGWDIHEVAFLYGTSYVVFKAADMCFGNLDKLPMFIRMGSFDQILTRPLGTLGQILAADIDLRHVGGIAQGAAVLAYALTGVAIDWTVGRVVVFASMLVSAFVIFGALWVITNSIAIWTTDARELANAVTYGGNFFTQHPLNMYAKWMQRLFGLVLVLGFINYFPSLYVLDHADPIRAPTVLRFVSPVAAAAVSVVAGFVWRVGVRHYRSTGS